MKLRLADLLASLSLVSDLGMGYQPEQALESCLIASALAGEMGLDESDRRDVYYTTLLAHVGCTAGAHEQAILVGGDDVSFRGIGSRVAYGTQREAFTDFMLPLTSEGSMFARARTLARLLTKGERVAGETNRATCEVAARMGRRLGLPETVQQALYEMFERWDGKGLPRKLAGDDISLPIRFSLVASQAALFNRIGGAELACQVIRDRAGQAFDPAIADAFIRCGPAILNRIAARDVWEAAVSAEPHPHRLASDGDLERIARAFADAVDLKSPFTHQHSVEVSMLAEGAACQMGLSSSTARTIRLAGLFHDLGGSACRTGSGTNLAR
ncbi:MAG: HD domain-containing phosphohydrolase [Thermomicrobiales bacterium]